MKSKRNFSVFLVALLSLNALAASNDDKQALAKAICEGTLDPAYRYDASCEVKESDSRGYKTFFESSWATATGSLIALVGVGLHLCGNENVGWAFFTGAGATAAGIVGPSVLINEHENVDKDGMDTSYSLLACSPSLRNTTIVNPYRATKTVDYNAEASWDEKPGKTGVWIAAYVQLLGSIANFVALKPAMDGPPEYAVIWHLAPLVAMAGGSLYGIIDAYVNRGEAEKVY